MDPSYCIYYLFEGGCPLCGQDSSVHVQSCEGTPGFMRNNLETALSSRAPVRVWPRILGKSSGLLEFVCDKNPLHTFSVSQDTYGDWVL